MVAPTSHHAKTHPNRGAFFLFFYQTSVAFHLDTKEQYINVVLCEPGKKARVTTIMNSLESLQKMVGGYIEAVYPFDDPVAIVCNEEGKIVE